MPRNKLTDEQRQRLAVPLFDLAPLPRRPEPPRARHGLSDRPGQNKVPWSPEEEVRRRLAALLAEAERASRGPSPAWRQLVLPGCEDLRR